MNRERNLIIKGGRDFFWQWDANQFLELVGVRAEQVHFESTGTQSYVVYVMEENGKLYAPVPNELLNTTEDIVAYVYDTSLLEGKFDLDGPEKADYAAETIFKRKFKVRGRQKPGDRPSTIEQENTFAELLNKAIVKVEQIQASDLGSGLNIIRITYRDGTFTDFNIYNGKNLQIEKVYKSVDEMNARFATDGLAEGAIVAINTDDVEMPENARLYIKTSTGYQFMVDLSGSKGIQGPAGEISDVTASVDNGRGKPSVNVQLTGTPERRRIHLEFSNLRGDKGDVGPVGPIGPVGPQGNIGEKGDPFRYDDFTPDQLESIRGPQGLKGDQGIQGIQGPIGKTGPQGAKGDKGDTGLQGPKGDKGDPGDVSTGQLNAALENYQKKLPLYLSEEGYICYGDKV